jgi:hypothetical protein
MLISGDRHLWPIVTEYGATTTEDDPIAAASSSHRGDRPIADLPRSGSSADPSSAGPTNEYERTV